MRFQSLSKKQNGVVLFIALIALVAMMAAAVALSSSLDAGAQISTNRFLMQSAQNSADVGFAKMKQEILEKIGDRILSSTAVADVLQSKWGCYHPYAFVSNIYTKEPIRDQNDALYDEWGEQTRAERPMDLNPRGKYEHAFVTWEGLPLFMTWDTPPDTHVCKVENTDLKETIYYMADLQCPDGRAASGGFTLDCLYPNNVSVPTGITLDHKIGLLVDAGGGRLIVKEGRDITGNEIRGLGFQGYGFYDDVNKLSMPSFGLPLIRVTVRVDGPRNTRTYRQQMISLFQNPAKR